MLNMSFFLIFNKKIRKKYLTDNMYFVLHSQLKQVRGKAVSNKLLVFISMMVNCRSVSVSNAVKRCQIYFPTLHEKLSLFVK